MTKVLDNSGSIRTVIYTEPAVSGPCPATDIEVNGVAEGSVVAGSTLDVQLSDSGGTVTPDSVTLVGTDLQIVLPDAPITSSVGASILRTGSTASYRTGDDYDRRSEGRLADFLTLASNNPFGNTNRFTDELGGTTYTNRIVIDWSTYQGNTVLGYSFGSTHNTVINWNNAIGNALLLNIGGFSTGWRVANIKELENTLNWGVTSNRWNYAPLNTFSLNAAFIQWSSTTNVVNTAQAHCWSPNGVGTFGQQNKTNTTPLGYIPVRTFTVTGTTLS